MKFETKFTAVQEASVEPDGTIKGYASLFGVKDQGGDIVMPGAFAESLAAQRAVRMLWQHDPMQPIGKWLVVREDERGLYVQGQLALKTQRGMEAYEMLKEGIIEGLSIGYRVERSKKTAAGRELWKMALWEISLVTFPMLVEASVTVKAMDDGAVAMFKRDVERFVRDAGYSACEAKAAAAGAADGLLGARDAADPKPDSRELADFIRQLATSNS